MLKQLILQTTLSLFWVFPAVAQTDRLVALVVSGEDGSDRADAVQTQLQALGAETLRATSPNNAQLRSILKRFAREAADARTSFVYLDVPVVQFENRAYVLPTGVAIMLDTDLFTQGIPIHAFARSSAQAEQGGAVVTLAAPAPAGIPATLAEVETAPDAVPGSSPILLLSEAGFDPMRAALTTAVSREEVELGALLRDMMIGSDASLSAPPTRPAYLKQPALIEITPPEPVVIGPELPTEDIEPVNGDETLQELTFLEKSLSRSAKRALQRQLRTLGHYRGLVDGIFGPQTRAAISAYQTDRNDAATGVLSRRQLFDLNI
ncbi:MAG: peptidoglycan-binding domain-containing protein [Pseudomonadota bacterium]